MGYGPWEEKKSLLKFPIYIIIFTDNSGNKKNSAEDVKISSVLPIPQD